MSNPFLRHIQYAYEEDIPHTDITTATLLHQATPQKASLFCKEDGIFCGEQVIEAIWIFFNKTFSYTLQCQDGVPITKGELLCTFSSDSHTLLRLERVLLNYLQRLCGIATQTHAFVMELDDPSIKILDTRKTTPGMREFEKYAVKAGGGENHRFSLSDMILIKENHLASLEKEVGKDRFLTALQSRLAAAKTGGNPVPIEIEIETLTQLETFDFTHVDYILLDNFKRDDILKAADIRKNRKIQSLLEVSGNVTLSTIRQYRHLPIHRISIGALTHSTPALDLSLLITE